MFQLLREAYGIPKPAPPQDTENRGLKVKLTREMSQPTFIPVSSTVAQYAVTSMVHFAAIAMHMGTKTLVLWAWLAYAGIPEQVQCEFTKSQLRLISLSALFKL